MLITFIGLLTFSVCIHILYIKHLILYLVWYLVMTKSSKSSMMSILITLSCSHRHERDGERTWHVMVKDYDIFIFFIF